MNLKCPIWLESTREMHKLKINSTVTCCIWVTFYAFHEKKLEKIFHSRRVNEAEVKGKVNKITVAPSNKTNGFIVKTNLAVIRWL